MRLEVAERALKTERQARETAERSLAEAQAAIRDLQTKLGHAMLVRDEARANAERAELEKLALEAALTAAQEARQTLEYDLLNVVATPRRKAIAETKPQSSKPVRTEPTAKSPAKTTSRGRSARSEPKPVKWWIKSK